MAKKNNFWDTPEGKILSYDIHEHNSGLSYIVNSALFIERLEKLNLIEIKFKDDKTKDRYYKSLEMIKHGKSKCKESMDYIYTNIKKLK